METATLKAHREVIVLKLGFMEYRMLKIHHVKK